MTPKIGSYYLAVKDALGLRAKPDKRGPGFQGFRLSG